MIVTATAADHCEWQAVILRADSVPTEKQIKGVLTPHHPPISLLFLDH